MHSELSEAMEGERKGLMDDKLPHRRMAEVELADTLIRIFDYAGGFGYDLQGAYEEKMAYNALAPNPLSSSWRTHPEVNSCLQLPAFRS